MLTRDVVAHFGSRRIVSMALGITRSAVHQWGDIVPPFRAAQIERLTYGKLKFDPADYPGYGQSRVQSTDTAGACR